MNKLIYALGILFLLFQISHSYEMKEEMFGNILFFDVDIYKKFDFNGDDVYDTILIVSRNSLYIVDSSGLRLLQRFPGIIYDLSDIDWDRDGKRDEIAILSSKIYILDKDGTILSKIEETGRSICSLDFDEDGYYDEIAIGKGDKLIVLKEGKEIFKRIVGTPGVKVKCHRNILVAFSSEILDVYESKRIVYSKALEERVWDVEFFDIDKDGIENDIAILLSDGTIKILKDFNEYYTTYISITSKCPVKLFPYDYDLDNIKESIGILSSDFVIIKDKQRIPIGLFVQCPDSFDLIDLDGDKILDDFVMGESSKYVNLTEVKKGFISVMNSGRNVYEFKLIYKEDEKTIEMKTKTYNKTGANLIATFDFDNNGVADELLVLDLIEGNFYIFKPLVKDNTRKKQREIILLANDIDYNLSRDFRDKVTDMGHVLKRIEAKDFEIYKKHKYVIILGGYKAYNGVGEIVEKLLKFLPVYKYEEYIRKMNENYTIIRLENIFSESQIIYIVAGKDRYKTREALMKYGVEIIRDFERH